MEKNERKKPGPKSVFDESLGTGVFKKWRFPSPIWDVLQEKDTRRVLDRMAMDEDYKRKIQQSWNE